MKTLELKPLSDSTQAKIGIPGSKSYTNRALFIAALSESKVKISNPLLSDDTRAMINCLKTLGIKILIKDNHLEVLNNIKSVKNLPFNLDTNESGTTVRFLSALATIIPGAKTLYGKEGLNKRPVGDLVEGLRQLGADIKYLGKEGYPPIKVFSSKLINGTVKIKGSTSSQYISAILMVAPLAGGVNIEVAEPQVSTPYIDMTIDTMEKFGVQVRNDNYKKYNISADQRYNAKQYSVEGDLSSASYFLAIAALTKSKITIEDINPHSKQADVEFIKILEDMGNSISFGENEVTITGTGVKPINVDMQDCPDQIQTLSILAAFADGISKITGISSLRIKETDRVFALRQELKKMGIKTSATQNVLTINGGNPKAAAIETYGDHRMAMSFAIAGAKLSGMRISDPDVVNKTFPEFFKKLNSIGINTKVINTKNIVLIGMRGSGKTTIAKLLAKKLNKKYLELDEMVVRKIGLTIPDMVKNHGWKFFRKQESKIIQKVSLLNNQIISTGGGAVTKQENITALKKNGLLIFLNASDKTLVKRMKKFSNLPVLTDKKTLTEEVKEILKKRLNLYQKSADVRINTDNCNPHQVVARIIGNL